MSVKNVQSIVPFSDVEQVNPLALINFNGAEESLKDVIPRAKINYGLGDEPPNSKRGDFVYSLGYSKPPEVRVVILAIKMGRIMWPAVFDIKKKDHTPLCKSDNGEHSSGGTLYLKNKPVACASCKHAIWNQGTPPKCGEVYSVLMWDVEDSMPFVISVKRTSIMALRRWKTTLKATAKKWSYPGTAPNASVSVLMRTRPVEQYFVLEFPQVGLKGEQLWKRLPEKEAQNLTSIAMDLSATFTAMDVEPDAAAGPSNASNDPEVGF